MLSLQKVEKYLRKKVGRSFAGHRVECNITNKDGEYWSSIEGRWIDCWDGDHHTFKEVVKIARDINVGEIQIRLFPCKTPWEMSFDSPIYVPFDLNEIK